MTLFQVQNLLFIVLLGVSSSYSNAQSNRIDSLRNVAHNAKVDTMKVSALLELGFLYKDSPPDSGLYYGKKALQLSEEIQYEKGLCESYLLLGISTHEKGDYQGSINYLKLSSKIAEDINDKKTFARAINSVGMSQLRLAQYDQALKSLMTALKIREELKDSLDMAGTMNNIGMIYSEISQPQEALSYYFQVLDIRKKLKHHMGIAQTLNNIAIVYEKYKEYDKALETYLRALYICDSIGEKFGQSLITGNIAGIYGQKKMYEESKNYYFKAIDLQKKVGNRLGLISSYSGLSNVYLGENDLENAEIYANQSLALSLPSGVKDEIKDMYRNLYKIAKAKRNIDDVIHFGELYFAYHDSLTDENMKSEITRIKAQSEYEEKLIETEESNRIQLEQQEYQLMFFMVAFILTLVVVLIFIINRSRLTKARNLAETASLAKSEFLSNMSHEIRTPLNAVIGFTDILTRERLTNEQMNYAKTANESAKTLLGVVNDILDYSKIEAGKIEIERAPFAFVDLKNQLRSVVSYQILEKQLHLQFIADKRLPARIWSDEIRLRQVLVNLLSNAIKFTHQGSITLKIDLLKKIDEHHIQVRFSVIDTGIGIAAPDQKVIFDAFMQADVSTTRKYGGTGLGLSICNKLLGLMGTTLRLESEVNKGSIFYFDLILMPDTAENIDLDTFNGDFGGEPTVSLPEVTKEYSQESKKILISEDNPVNMLLAKTLIRDFAPNAEIFGAVSGVECVELYKLHQPDLVLMDVQMPELNGYQTTELIRTYESAHRLKKAPIVAISAGTTTQEKENCIKSGMDGFLSKPIIRSEFEDLLRKHLH